MKFTANYVEPYTNSTTDSVMFADTQKDPDEPTYLSFQRPTEFKNSAYYFEINDQSYSRYEGLESVRVGRNRLEVRLTRESVAKFGNEDFAEIQVEFTVDDARFQQVLATLRRIFDGFGIFQEQ